MGGVERSVLPVALRAWMVRPGRTRRTLNYRPAVASWPEGVLIFDMETTVDPTQRLLFGSYRIGKFGRHGEFSCKEEGIIYADDLAERDPEGFVMLQSYVASHRPATDNPHMPAIQFHSRHEFAEKRLWKAIQSGALIVGYNLAFDMTRLGIECGEARHAMFQGGFSVLLFSQSKDVVEEHDYRPRFRARPIDGKRTLMGLTRRKGATPEERGRPVEDHGRLLDLKHLTFALTDRNLSLASAAHAFGLEAEKMEVEEHGVISERYNDYNRQDVEVTAQLLEAVRAEWDRHPVALAPEKVMSPASVGKGYLRAMGVIPPAIKFADVGASILGASLTAYFGGRTEVRVRRCPVPVVYVDFLSMYPTVNALMGLWGMLTAERLTVRPATAEVQAFLQAITLERCFDPSTWKDLRFFAKIRPQGDIMPVRAAYGETPENLTIGVNPFWSEVPIWVSGPDLVASVLLTGKVPEVLEAVRLVPIGKQKGLECVALRGQVPVDPMTEDFFTRLIEERQLARRRPDATPEERDRLQKFLKVMANSASYGIFAEINPQVRGDAPEAVEVHGLDGMFPTVTRAPEEGGEFCFPPFAALTTACARLMLALLERCVSDLGGQIAFGDTDSAAIVATQDGSFVQCPGGPDSLPSGAQGIRSLSWSQVAALTDRFKQLSPYDPEIVPGSILKVEDINYDKDHHQIDVHAFAISAKRYALFRKTPTGIEILDAKEHGLGHLLDPMDQAARARDEELSSGKSSTSKTRRWILLIWEALIREALGEPLELPAWVDRPALSRVTISSSALLKTFQEVNRDRSYADSIKPMNFGLSPIVAPFGHPEGADPVRFHLLGQYQRDPSKWLTMSWIDKYSGKEYRIGLGRETPTDQAQVKSYRDVIDAYRVHPEPKSLDALGRPCSRESIGMLFRRPVELGSLDYVGKESNAVEEVTLGLVHNRGEVQPVYGAPQLTMWDLVYLPAIRRIGIKHLAQVTGLGERMIRLVQKGQRGTITQHELVLKREANLWAAKAHVDPKTIPEDREIARRVLAIGQVNSLQTQLPMALRAPSRRRRGKRQVR